MSSGPYTAVTWPTDGIVSAQAVNLSGQAVQDTPITFGQVFARGAVPSGQSLQAAVAGQSVPMQIDEKATYPSDGSLRHAVVTVLMPSLDANGRSLLTLRDGANSIQNTPAITIGGLLATDFQAKVTLNVGGTTYQADARALLRAAVGQCHPWGSTCNQWLAGPLASEWIVGGTVNPHLTVYFHVRAYAQSAGGAVTRARVDTVVENDWAYVADPSDVTYSANIQVGNQSYKIDNLNHYYRSRWHKILWWGGAPDVYARVDGRYLQATGAISQYPDIHPTDYLLNHVRYSCAPMQHCDQTQHMGNAGAQASIGPLPRWTTEYVLGTDYRAYRWMLANADAVGAYNFHYRDKNTGKPVTLLDHPDASIIYNTGGSSAPDSWKADAFAACGGTCSDPNRFDISHHPSIGYVPYLVTGDFYYLEELQFADSYIAFWSNPGYRRTTVNGQSFKYLLAEPQVRGQAWAMRTLGDTAFATPDNAPLKAYWQELVTQNLDYYNARYVNNPNANALHIVANRGAFAYQYPEGSGNYVGIAPWQDHFFTWAIGHLADQGFDGAVPLLSWKAKFPMNLMTGNGYCWLLGAAYSLQMTSSSKDASQVFGDISKVYNTSFPELAGYTCNTQVMRNKLGEIDPKASPVQVNQMVGYPGSPTGYPANLQPALAVATSLGVPGAAAAWVRFQQRSIKPDYHDYANFDVVPRPN